MGKIWSYSTRVGTFYIKEKDGRYNLEYDDETLGNYAEPWQAAEDLSLGATFSVEDQNGNDIDTSKLDIPDDLSEWRNHS